MITIKFIIRCAFLFVLLCSYDLSAQFKLYEKGHDSYTAGKYPEAIRFFSDYLTKGTRDKSIDIDVFYLRALSYYKNANYKEAVPDFEETLLRGHQNKGNIYWFMAKCYDKLNQDDECVNSYSNAIRELKDNQESRAKLLFERSIIYARNDQKALAYTDLNEAIALRPENQYKEELKKLGHIAVAGRNPAEVPVANEKEKSKTETVKKTDSPTVTLSPLAELYKNEKRYALVIGNSQYPKEIGLLRNPVNDATDMAQELKDSHFEVQLLTNATYGQIRAALMKFKEKLDAGDRENTVGLFYFAGHGVQFEDENFLIPVDASVQYEDDIPRYCFPIQRMVVSNMERSNSRMNIIILDACRNNPFPSLHRNIGRSGLGELKKGRGSFIAYATEPGSIASDGSGRNGLYTQELLRALKKPGLTIEQVFKEVRANVLRLSGNKQNTWDSSNIIGEFHFKF